MSSRSVIFDLDGTLIDSQGSIISALRAALSESAIEAKVPITKELIGPPLIDTLSNITGLKDKFILNEIAVKFMLYYDTLGYMNSQAYPGMHYLLKCLHNQGFNLYIATNKRLIPTKKIVGYLSWDLLFSAIYSIDSNAEKPYKNKSEMISALLGAELIDRRTTVYVGDRIEDYEAAKLNQIRCVLVDWGYGADKSKFNGDVLSARDSADLLITLQKII
jgi:phosphoglycolate phosphatase